MIKKIRLSRVVFFVVWLSTCEMAITVSAQYPAWTVQDGTSEDDVAQAVSVDENGNIFVAGQTRGDFGSNNHGETDALLCRYDSDGNLIWSRLLGSKLYEQDAFVDASVSQVFLGGSTNGNLAGSLGGFDSFLARYDIDGNPIWAKQLGTLQDDFCGGVSTTAANNICLGGSTFGDFAGANEGDDDGFLVKLDANGNEFWRRQFGTTQSDLVRGVSTDIQGNIFVSGTTLGDLAGSSNGGRDGFVIKYDSNGMPVWLRQFGTSGDEIVTDNHCDQAGSVVICGSTDGGLAGANQGASDAFALKYDPAGNLVWIRQWGTPEADSANALTTDSADDVFVTGGTSGIFEGQSGAGMVDIFTSKIDASGQFIWLTQFGSNNSESGQGIASDFDRNIYSAGQTSGSVGGPPLGGLDLFVSKVLATETIIADRFTILRGQLVSGGIDETTDSDDQYLKLNPGITLNSSEPPVWVEFEFTLPSNNPQTALFKFESRASTPGLRQTIEVYSWFTEDYWQLDVRDASFNEDTTFVINLITDTFSYIDPDTGRVRVRVGWKAQGFVLQYPWEIGVDEIVWEVNEFSG